MEDDLNQRVVTSPTLTSTSDETDDDYNHSPHTSTDGSISPCSSSTHSLMSPIRTSTPVTTPATLNPSTPLSTLCMTPPNRMSTLLDACFSDNEGTCDISLHSPDSADSSSRVLDVSMLTSPSNESTLSTVNPDTHPDTYTDTHSGVVPQSVNAGFKIVFDNIDKTIKPRHMTLNSQTTSLHYVQAMAVKDRIDYSFLSDKIDPERECNLYDILPDADDYDSLKKRFITHISRMIVAYLSFFKVDFLGLVPAHIPHRYSSVMSSKTEVVSNTNHINTHFLFHDGGSISSPTHIMFMSQVPLGVLPKNETKYEDMIDILEDYKNYVPFKTVTLPEPLTEGTTVITKDKSYVRTLIGGDYLSAVRARGAQLIRRTSELEERHLDGFLPVSEDWHSKVCLLEASILGASGRCVCMYVHVYANKFA